jgi:HTH-type transcriptional repressor of NAD biosynthesis genes
MYKNGMYGGKFMPFHKGHFMCVQLAAQECETLHVILCYGGVQEEQILKEMPEDWLQWEARFERVKAACAELPNVVVHAIDVTHCRNPDGTENWDMETPLILEACGKLDAVYGSEPSYAPYYARAYPGAEYRIVDVERTIVPISGTAIRNMSKEEREKWAM